MAQKQKLELTWIGKENRPRLEPRILLEDPEKSFHAQEKVSENDIFDNRLIFGDNLLALKALEQEFAGKVKCIYIDPPFNTHQQFPFFEDGLEHSRWLSLVRDRIVILHRLLSPDGTLFVHIDDNELAYLTVLLDELLGRENRIHLITFQQGSATGHKAINPGCVNTTNFVLIYAKDKSSWQPKKIFTGRERDKRYTQFIENRNASHSQWRFSTLMAAFANFVGETPQAMKRSLSKFDLEEKLNSFVIENANSVIQFARPDYDAVSSSARAMIDLSKSRPSEIFLLERKEHSNMYFKGGQRILFYIDKVKIFNGVPVSGEPLTTLWDDILSNNLHNEGGVEFPKSKKPEALIERVIELATKRGEIVLDSFAGSGTTGAVAHKMGRRWIMVELGDHIHTHIIPRMVKVVNGTDPGGITESANWKGGGGFRYFRLAPTLIEQDRFGMKIISKQYNPAMLAEAMCKLLGYKYAPNPEVYWQHGQSTEKDYLYITTQTLSHEQLAQLSEEVGEDRTLLVCCCAFRGKAAMFRNLTVQKIPSAVLDKCEWGHDDYSLQVANLPQAPKPAPPPQMALFGNGTAQQE